MQTLGITPAYAGNTCLWLLRFLYAWDHPRLRGEYFFFKQYPLHSSGSPPLTRGIRRFHDLSAADRRITPAYAGNTLSVPFPRRPLGDHPRLRGEYFGNIEIEFFGKGSPPLTRGIPQVQGKSTSLRGITPAYAGNTLYILGRLSSSRDHPRLRGEYNEKQRLDYMELGSPPLTRGILSCA